MSENPITQLINSLGPRRALAGEIGASEAQVHKWAQFGRIPAEWQHPVVLAAQAKGRRDVTAEWILKAHHDRAQSGDAA